jgi:hypothetical protein
MKIFGKNVNKILFPNIRVLLVPILSLLILFVLIIMTVRFSYLKIIEQNTEIKELSQKIEVLDDKLEILRLIKNKILDDADMSLMALPSENPGLWKMAQISKLAEENNVEISRKELSNEKASKGLRSTILLIHYKGELSDVLKFLENTFNMVPLTQISSVNLTVKGGKNATGDTEIEMFRASLPEKLPKLTEPIKNLTDEQEELLDTLSLLKLPEFTSLEPDPPSLRVDPFNY